MSEVIGLCAQHPGVTATFACQRCGTFVCAACERRTRPEALPLCPACWELRTHQVAAIEHDVSKRMQIGGLVVGVLSFLNPLIQIGSYVLNIRELRRGTGGSLRWMNVVGLIITITASLAWILIIAIAASR